MNTNAGTQSPGHVAAAGWYPSSDGNGTFFWDGYRWTGDFRPARRPFAAAASHRGWGIFLNILGAFYVLASPSYLFALSDRTFIASVGMALLALFIGLALVAWGVYLVRGQGPTNKLVRARLQQTQAQAAQQALVAEAAAAHTVNINIADQGAIAAAAEASRVAQIQALADPATAKAIQNLQNLLYTRAITDEEYQAAKNKLLG